MGYYTNYELEVVKGDLSINEILETVDDYSNIFYAVDENGESTGETKWYRHDKDMKELSIKFPESVFALSGKGEEAGDLWKKYYKNGLVQRCPAIVSYEEYDENKLEVI